MELRFLDGKLEYRDRGRSEHCPWIPVPKVESEKKYDPCPCGCLLPHLSKLAYESKPKEATQGKEWCSHVKEVGNDMVQSPVISLWDICPVKGCHAPRPKSKESLEEKFKSADFLTVQGSRPGGFSIKSEYWSNLASIARKHFSEGGV